MIENIKKLREWKKVPEIPTYHDDLNRISWLLVIMI